MAATQASTQLRGFLDLPTELHLIIYRFLFDGVALSIELPLSEHLITAILEVCWRTRLDASVIFYKTVDFEIGPEHLCLRDPTKFRNPVPYQLRRGWLKHIRSIEIDMSLAPAFIEDYPSDSEDAFSKEDLVFPAQHYLPSLKYFDVLCDMEVGSFDVTLSSIDAEHSQITHLSEEEILELASLTPNYMARLLTWIEDPDTETYAEAFLYLVYGQQPIYSARINGLGELYTIDSPVGPAEQWKECLASCLWLEGVR